MGMIIALKWKINCSCSCCRLFLWRTGAVNDTTMVACSFSPCSQMFMTGSTYGDLRLWDLRMNQLHAEKNAHDLGVSCCTFAPSILSGENCCCASGCFTAASGNKGPYTLDAYNSCRYLVFFSNQTGFFRFKIFFMWVKTPIIDVTQPFYWSQINK